MPETSSGRQTTELRVLISEDALGNLDAEWQALIKGTEVTIPMRPSHVAGQLVAASFIVLAKSYKGIFSEVQKALETPPVPSNSKERNHVKRQPARK